MIELNELESYIARRMLPDDKQGQRSPSETSNTAGRDEQDPKTLELTTRIATLEKQLAEAQSQPSGAPTAESTTVADSEKQKAAQVATPVPDGDGREQDVASLSAALHAAQEDLKQGKEAFARLKAKAVQLRDKLAASEQELQRVQAESSSNETVIAELRQALELHKSQAALQPQPASPSTSESVDNQRDRAALQQLEKKIVAVRDAITPSMRAWQKQLQTDVDATMKSHMTSVLANITEQWTTTAQSADARQALLRRQLEELTAQHATLQAEVGQHLAEKQALRARLDTAEEELTRAHAAADDQTQAHATNAAAEKERLASQLNELQQQLDTVHSQAEMLAEDKQKLEILLAGSQSEVAAHHDQITALKLQLQKAHDAQGLLEKRATAAEDQLQHWQAKHAELNREHATLRERHVSLEEQHGQLRQTHAELQERRSQQQEHLQRSSSTAEARARELEMALQNRQAEFADELRALQESSEADLADVQRQLSLAREAHHKLEQSLQKEKADAANAQVALAQQIADLQTQRDAAQSKLAEHQADLEEVQRELDASEAAQMKLQQEIKQLHEALDQARVQESDRAKDQAAYRSLHDQVQEQAATVADLEAKLTQAEDEKQRLREDAETASKRQLTDLESQHQNELKALQADLAHGRSEMQRLERELVMLREQTQQQQEALQQNDKAQQQQQEQEALQQRLEEEQREHQKHVKEHEILLAQLQHQVKELRIQLDDSQADAAALREQVQEYEGIIESLRQKLDAAANASQTAAAAPEQAAQKPRTQGIPLSPVSPRTTNPGDVTVSHWLPNRQRLTKFACRLD